jgi:hypothetical protein
VDLLKKLKSGSSRGDRSQKASLDGQSKDKWLQDYIEETTAGNSFPGRPAAAALSARAISLHRDVSASLIEEAEMMRQEAGR